MSYPQVVFTAADHAILNSYKTLVEGLAAYLGDGYEFVLHSLENLDHSAIKVANGHHTGRKEGAPITDLALSMLNRLSEPESTSYVCYNAKNKHGAPLRSTTIAIYGENNQVIGLLCINLYMDTPLASWLSSFGLLPEPAVMSTGQALPSETFADSSKDLIIQAVHEACFAVNADSSIRPSLRNREIIARLYAQGLFNMKDAVTLVSNTLNISTNTVYLHLRHIKGT